MHFSERKGMLGNVMNLGGIGGLWGAKKEKKVEKPAPIKNEIKINIFKRMKDHEKFIFSEGIGNYARFI